MFIPFDKFKARKYIVGVSDKHTTWFRVETTDAGKDLWVTSRGNEIPKKDCYFFYKTLHSAHATDFHGYMLNDELTEWLDENNVNYSFGVNTEQELVFENDMFSIIVLNKYANLGSIAVFFETPEDMLAFKLIY